MIWPKRRKSRPGSGRTTISIRALTTNAIVNALEPGTQVPVHHHPTKDETFVILKGKVKVLIYNDQGEVVESCVLSHEEGRYGVDIPKNVWHSLECSEPCVLLECKEGPFVEHEVDGILEINK